jgi:hypothetical protein
MNVLRNLMISGALLPLVACTMPRAADVAGEQSQLEIRQMQSREYDSLDKRMALRSTIATLQDLGFYIDNADLDLGTVTATRHSGQTLRMTVTARERAGDRVVVRANARLGEIGITEMDTYQDFFVALDKAIFLTLNDVD